MKSKLNLDPKVVDSARQHAANVAHDMQKFIERHTTVSTERTILRLLGVDGVDEMSQEEYRKAAIDAVKQLSKDVGIPADLKEIVKPEDIDFLSQSAYDDACRPGNPRETSVDEIKKLYLSLM